MVSKLIKDICLVAFVSLVVVSTAAAETSQKCCRKGTTPNPKNRIVFDASAQKFVDVPAHLSAQGDNPAIVVLHPNSFREKYTVKVSKINLFTAGLPAALSGLLVTSAPSRSGALLAEKRSEGELPNELTAEWTAFQSALEGVQSTMPLSSTEILDTIRQGSDNFDIRQRLVEKIQKTVKNHEGEKKAVLDLINAASPDKAEVDDDPTVFQTSEQIKTLANATDEPARAFDKATRAWNAAFKRLTSPNKSAKDCNSDVAAAATNFGPETTDRKERQAMKHLYREVLLSPRVFPSRLVIPADIAGSDQVDVTIQVDQSLSSSLPINPAGDDKDPLNRLNPQDPTVVSRQYTTSIPIYWRLVRDFSAGLVSTSLKQVNYYVDKTVTPNVVRRGAGDDKNIGAAVLAQVYFTTPFWLTAGPCLGVSVTDNARFLLGGSVVLPLGRRVRLSYSYGWAYGKVTVLNGDIENSPPNGTSVSTASVYREGTFHSATISITF